MPQEENAPLGDAMFGEDPVAPEEKPTEEKKFADIPEDHPTIVELKGKIDAIKSEYGGNLSGQRGKIEKLEAEIETLRKAKGTEGGAEGEEDVLYKKDEIKWSKDLTQDQRDEMTKTEIEQMDEIARMKENQNKVYAGQMKEGKEKKEEKQSDLNGWVRAQAKELAGDDVDVANQIIEATKMLALEGLDEATVKERVVMASKFVPDYKAPKEQQHRGGKPPVGGGKQEDPFGVDAIVESVHKAKEGGGYSL